MTNDFSAIPAESDIDRLAIVAPEELADDSFPIEVSFERQCSPRESYGLNARNWRILNSVHNSPEYKTALAEFQRHNSIIDAI